MKKTIYVLLVLTLFLIAGCVEKEKPSGDKETPITEPGTDEDKGEVTDIKCDASIPCSEGYECVKLPDKDSPTCIKPEVLQSPEYKDCVMLESYPPQLKCPDKTSQVDAYACKEDSDCVIKDVHNCCGYYPRCVNKDYEPDIEAVKKECAEKGMASVCGWSDITGCKCVDNKCVST